MITTKKQFLVALKDAFYGSGYNQVGAVYNDKSLGDRRFKFHVKKDGVGLRNLTFYHIDEILGLLKKKFGNGEYIEPWLSVNQNTFTVIIYKHKTFGIPSHEDMQKSLHETVQKGMSI